MGGHRWSRRRGLVALAATALALMAALAGLAWRATDLLLAAVRNSAASRGLVLEVSAGSRLRPGGVETGRVALKAADGRLLLGASALRVRWLPWAAGLWAVVEVEADDVEIEAGGPAGDGLPLAPVLPARVASVAVKRAVIRLAPGTELEFDGRIVRGDGDGERWQFDRLDWREDSGERAAEGLRGQIAMAATGAGSMRVDLSVHAGTVLAGAVLIDLGAYPFEAGAIVGPGGRPGAVALHGFDARLGTLLAAKGDAELEEDGTPRTWSVDLASEQLAALFATFVREPFAPALPLLDASFVEGRARLVASQATPSPRSLKASLAATLSRAGLASLEARGVEATLPWAGAASGAGAVEGRVEIASLGVGGLEWKGVGASLRATPGLLESTGPRAWSSAAGTLRVARVALRQDEGLAVEAEVSVDGHDAGALVPGLAGRLHGRLGRVRLDGRGLAAEGSLVLEALGGKVRLSGLGIDDPFGRVPAFRAEVEVEGLDLGAATSATGFGRVEGILEGSVRGLVVAGGQPQAFDADLHTVARKGVDQTVDVRAITQLGVLGGGDSSATSALLGLVDRYRYAALGVKCRLRNDTFELRGVETKDGRDYLVKGTLLPPSVSVVSHSQVVSFSEMLRRVERMSRLGQGGSQP